jgi:hypothetical protein
MTTEEAQAAAVAENLKNPDGTDITTEEQLLAARELAANPPEEITETPEQKEIREQAEREAAAAEDPLLKVMLQDLNPVPEKEPQEILVEAAPEPAAEREKNLTTLKEWGVTMPADATDEAIAAKVAEGKPAPAVVPPVEKPKRKKFSVVKKESVEIVETPPPAPTAPPARAAVAADADAEYIRSLTPEQQDELYEAEVAEMLEPAKFKGQKAKLVEFFRRFDKEMVEIQRKEPDTNLEDSDQFKSLVRAKPVLDQHIIKKVNREIGSREGQRRAQSEFAPKIESIEISQRRTELAPKFQKFVVEEFNPGVVQLIEADPKSSMAEAIKVIKEKGIEAAREDFKLEAKIYQDVTAAAARRVEKFLLFKNNAMQLDPKLPDEDLGYVMQVVENEGRIVAEYEAKNGRIVDKARKFLPRTEFIAMLGQSPDEAATLDRRNWKTKSFCTLTDIIILDCLAKYTKNDIEFRIAKALEVAGEVGLERRPRGKTTSTTTPPAKPPVEINPPRSVPVAGNGAGKLPPPPKPRAQDIDVLATNYPHLVRK